MNNIPQELLIPNLHLFYHYFNKLTDKLNPSLKNYTLIYNDMVNLLKEFYITVFNETINGKINNLLSDDIFNNDNIILKFIKDPSDYIKNTLEKKYSEDIQKKFVKNDNLNMNIKWIIENENSNKTEIKKQVDEIEGKYKKDKINKYIQETINDVTKKLNKYNSILYNIKQPNQK